MLERMLIRVGYVCFQSLQMPGILNPPGAGFTGKSKPLNVGAGSWTLVLCKSSTFLTFEPSL